MVPGSYPLEFRRRKVLDLVESGRPVAEVAEQLGVSEAELKQVMASRRNFPAVTKTAASLAGDVGMLDDRLRPHPRLTTTGTSAHRSPSQHATRTSVEGAVRPDGAGW